MTPPDVQPPDAPAPTVDGPEIRSLHRARAHGATEPERSWTPLGTVDAGVLGVVDGAGLVRVGERSWSLDWWIGAEDRWHHPSQEATVRQRALDGAPVVETAIRVPGGDITHRAYGAQASAGEWRGPAIVVELENLTAVPVALALVVRPVTLDGPGRVGRVESDGSVVLVDGRPDVLLGRDPARVAAGHRGRVAAGLAAGEDSVQLHTVEDPAGDLEVAFVVPLAHTAVARVLLPVDPAAARPGAATPAAPWDAPTAGAVAAGWSVHGGDDVRIMAPEPGWPEALAWASRMLLLAGPDEVGGCLDRDRVPPAGPPAAVRVAEVAEALARIGSVDGLDAISGALAGAQRLGGDARLGDRSDGSVALLHAAGPVLGGPYGASRVEDLVAPVAVAVRRVRKGRGVADGLASSAVRALRSLAPVLVSVGQPEVAQDALAAAASLGGVEAPRGAREDDGPSTLARAVAARHAIARGGGLDELRALWDGHLDAGRSDAEVDGVACGASGFDTAELAARTNALLDVFVADGELGPDVLPVFPPSWAGNGVEAHGLATPWGTVSYAVRWHGPRPAVLWEVEPPPGLSGWSSDAATPAVRSSGLDPAWRGTGWSGEALLGASGAADGGAADGGAGPTAPGEGDSFS